MGGRAVKRREDLRMQGGKEEEGRTNCGQGPVPSMHGNQSLVALEKKGREDQSNSGRAFGQNDCRRYPQRRRRRAAAWW